LIRPSTPSDAGRNGMDARIKSGHDDSRLLNCCNIDNRFR
jgi:hypothetical protein